VRGLRQAAPNETIGVLELKADGTCPAVFAERAEVDGRCHIRLARQVWEGKDSLDTRWWSLVLDSNYRVYTVRNGSCGDALLKADVDRVVRALEALDLLTADTMLALDDGLPTLPRRPMQQPASVAADGRVTVGAGNPPGGRDQ
jgi:hypothetical protein